MKIGWRWSAIQILVVSLAFVISSTSFASPNTKLSSASESASSNCEPFFQRDDFKTCGYFDVACQNRHHRLAEIYREAGIIKKIEGNIRRVGQSDLAVNFERLSRVELARLTAQGRNDISKLYVFTSGAGLWSRGGGQVKALIPYNIKELLSEEDYALLVESGNIANAAKPEDVLRLAGRITAQGDDIRLVAKYIVRDRQEMLSNLIAKARSNPRSLTPIDMKLANIAIQSERAGTYIPFDIWTSEQTHEAIRNYLNEFEQAFWSKVFHPVPAIDRLVKSALNKYLTQSRNLGETHVFGYQVGYHALDPDSLSPLKDTPAIGEGAGMAKAYLDEAGRTRELLIRGKTTWVFENIEVMTDLPVAMGAHVQHDKQVSVILVPERPGYKGGSPFLVDRGRGWNLELHEMSVLPPEFAEGNEYFNSNTIFQPLDLAPPRNVGFELKNTGTGKIIRVKMNAGDITMEASTAGVGGRIGVEYENFKSYSEFGQNGQQLIETYQKIWERDVQ